MGTFTIPAGGKVAGQSGFVADINNAYGALTAVAAYNVCNTAYGADPTGSADSTVAIQAALNAAPAGGVVYLPAGTYKVSAPLQVPTGVVLAGDHANVLSLTDYGSVIVPSSSWAQGSAPGSAVILLNAGEEQQVKNLMIDGSSLPVTADGVQCYGGVNNVKLLDLNIRNVTGIGVSSAGAAGTTMRAERVTVHQATASGFNCQMTDATWLDCLAEGGSAQGFYITGGSENSKWVGCRGEWNTDHGFYITGSFSTGNGSGGVQLTGCSTDRNGQSGIRVDATGNSPVNITGLMCRRDGSSSTSSGYAGLEITSATVPVIADGVTCYPGVNDNGTGNDSPQYGISSTGSTWVGVTNAYLHAVSAGLNGSLNAGRAIVTRTGSTSSPGTITPLPDTARAAASSTTTLSNSSALTTLATLTLGTGSLAAGSTFRVNIMGSVQTQATSGTLTFTVTLAGTTLTQTLQMPSQSGASGPSSFWAEMFLTVQSLGSSGTAIAHGRGEIEFSGRVNLDPSAPGIPTTTTVNTTTTTPAVTVNAQWATSSTTNILTVTVASIEQVA
jgi:hypothetical protein